MFFSIFWHFCCFQGIKPDSFCKVKVPELKEIIEGCIRMNKDERYFTAAQPIDLILHFENVLWSKSGTEAIILYIHQLLCGIILQSHSLWESDAAKYQQNMMSCYRACVFNNKKHIKVTKGFSKNENKGWILSQQWFNWKQTQNNNLWTFKTFKFLASLSSLFLP